MSTGAARSAVRRAARASYARLGPRARARLLQRLGPRASALGLQGGELGLVSWVVVVERIDLPRLTEALRSVRAQSHGLLDVAVVPVAPVAEADLRAALDAVDDPRFRTLPAAPTWQAAVRHGAEGAHADRVGFLRGCDSLTWHAVTDLARSLAASGSEVATGPLLQLGQEEVRLRRAQERAHARPGAALPVAERPELASDLTLANKLFTTAAARRLRLGPDDTWLESPALARLLATAQVDVIVPPIARYGHEHGTRAFGAMPSPLTGDPDLSRWRVHEAAVDAAVAGTALESGWRDHVADVALPHLLLDAERATGAQWAVLVELARDLVTGATTPTWTAVGAQSRVLLELAAADRREDVEAVAAEAYVLDGQLRTVRDEHRLLARWKCLPEHPGTEVPAVDSPLVVQVRRVSVGADRWTVDVFTRVEHLDLSTETPALEAVADGAPALTVEHTPDPAAEAWANRWHQSAANGSFRVTVPADPTRLRLRLELTLRVGELARSATVEVSAPPPPAPGAATVTPRLDGEQLEVGPVRLPLRTDRFGTTIPLPPGRRTLSHPDGLHLPGAPVTLHGDLHRITVGQHGGELVVDVAAPHTDDELGRWHQRRMRRDYQAYAQEHRPLDPGSIYVESYAGRSATDSPLAIAAELHRRHPELRVHWGISDHSQRVPEWATPVLMRSRHHYDTVARASLVVSNTDLDEWFRHRPDQLVVQCFHGYPSKSMGKQQWASRDYPPSRVEAIRRRTVATWDLILTPTPAMTEHYREQYDYAGPVVEQGYPRDDDLVLPGAAQRREEVRRVLGIAPGQTAVLYAPTWRDHLATLPREAAMADFLDVEQAARDLGPDHVILLRGHRFHRPRTSQPVGAARVVDVTEHPEINDLVLATDVAVLDYSSLRFDVALTGVPMVFLVPDLDLYDGPQRGFLYPFADSAPGPLVATTDEVIALVRDTPRLAREWAARVAEFAAAYHPYADGRATQRVVDRIEQLLADRRVLSHRPG